MTSPADALSGEQAEQLPALSDRPLEDIEAVAEVLVEVRSISSQLSFAELQQELTSRLARVNVALPPSDLQELAEQLSPSAER